MLDKWSVALFYYLHLIVSCSFVWKSYISVARCNMHNGRRHVFHLFSIQFFCALFTFGVFELFIILFDHFALLLVCKHAYCLHIVISGWSKKLHLLLCCMNSRTNGKNWNSFDFLYCFVLHLFGMLKICYLFCICVKCCTNFPEKTIFYFAHFMFCWNKMDFIRANDP